jgi:hypothetical protein
VIILSMKTSHNHSIVNSQTDPRSLIRSHQHWRLIEMIPGLLTWSAFLLIILGSFFFPYVTANLIIAYTLIWVFRSFYFNYHLINSYQSSRRAALINWKKLLNYVESPNKLAYLIKKGKFSHDPLVFKNKDGKLEPALYQRLTELKAKNQYLKPSEIIHCLSLVTYKEPYEVIKASVESYIQSNYNLKKVIFLLSCEAGDYTNALSISQRIKAEYGHYFMDYLHTFHPKGLPNEIPGRAGNATWSCKALKAYLEKKNIPFHKVILSSFDADTIITPEYLNELTFRYCINENRIEVGYQPIPFYHNNIWDVPLFNRLVAISCSFWQLSVSGRTGENKSFSSRAMSFQSVLDFNYWDPMVVQDDSRQYWTAFFVYNGRHHLETIYSPVYMDAVQSESYLKTVQSQYKQLRRWAWGASDLPFIFFNLLKSKEIPAFRKFYEVFHFLESIFFWATGPIMLIFAGFIPSILNASFKGSVLSYNLPLTMSNLLNFASLGIFICIFITLKVVPFSEQKSLIKKAGLFIQWMFVPIVSITLSAIPAIDAQTRLLINKRLDFQVTEKARSKKSS